MVSKNIKCEYSRSRVNKAGDNIRAGKETLEDLVVIEKWRASHHKILNDWQANLRTRCKGKNIVFAQRLKRKSTIFDKLRRQPDMKLARMHDIAGCRLIFKNIAQLNNYRDHLHKSRMKHIRRKSEVTPYPYDYIQNPHPDLSGYRGIHDIYQYCAFDGREKDWDDLLVEIQYRTNAQHAWATANEIAGSLTGNQSKFGRGNEMQKEFFRLASEIIARSEEKLKSCYPNFTNSELIKKFDFIEKKTGLLRQLKNLKIASKHHNFFKKNTILIHSEKNKTLDIFSYQTLSVAQEQYFAFEKQYGENADIVLVRTPSKETLKQAYKNYFSDAQDFTRLIEKGLKGL